MPVFYITVYVYGLKFRKCVSGFRRDYTNEQLAKMQIEYENKIKKAMSNLGCCE